MPGGAARVFGHAAPWPSHWIDIGQGAGGPVRQNLELAAFSAESGLALRPLTVVEDETPENALDGMRRDWQTSVGGVSVATNYGYAVQWFAMSIVFFGLYVWLQFIRPRRPSTPVDDLADNASSR
jgi:surfeit locus 1 family protein